MSGINIVIACVGLSGFLPLAIFLYRRKKANRIFTTGHSARAIIFHVSTSTKPRYDIVNYCFIASDGKQYKGRLMTSQGVHKVNEEIEVFYLANNPKRNTVKGAWQSNWLLAFVIIIAIAVLFMSYKLYEMENKGAVT